MPRQKGTPKETNNVNPKVRPTESDNKKEWTLVGKNKKEGLTSKNTSKPRVAKITQKQNMVNNESK
jgi:hypothetical protein